MQYDHTDGLLLEWLEMLSREAESRHQKQPVVEIREGLVKVQVKLAQLAQFSLKTWRRMVNCSSFGLKIYVGEEIFDFVSPTYQNQTKTMIEQKIEVSRSFWAKTNKIWLKAQNDRDTITIHSTRPEKGYQFIDVFPLLGLESVLAIPSWVSTGKSLFLDEPEVHQWTDQDPVREEDLKRAQIIAGYKRVVIEEAIASRDIARKPYSIEWEGRMWHKVLVAVPVSDEEIVISTRSPDDELAYWQDQLNPG